MQISVIPHRVIVHQNSDGDHMLIFKCTNEPDSSVIEIGDKYVFSNAKSGFFSKAREQCELSIWVRPKSSSRVLPEGKVGNLRFCGRYEARDDIPARPACLEAEVWLEQATFDRLMTALLLGKKPDHFEIYFEGEGILSYGWEPDGSRIEWKIQSDKKTISTVNVSTFSYQFTLFG